MLDATQAQRLLRLICMQHKNNSEVDVAKDSASRRRILRKILENLDEWNLRISTVDIKLMHHQLSASSSASEWLDAAAGAIVDIFKLSDEHEDDSGKVAKKAKKFNSIWIIPYLVRNLKFLQSRVLKVKFASKKNMFVKIDIFEKLTFLKIDIFENSHFFKQIFCKKTHIC